MKRRAEEKSGKGPAVMDAQKNRSNFLVIFSCNSAPGSKNSFHRKLLTLRRNDDLWLHPGKQRQANSGKPAL